MNDQLKEIQKTQHDLELKGGRHLGTLMWWNLNGNRISHADLEALAQRYGMPAEYLPSEIKPNSAFKRAVRHATTKLDKEHMLRTINDDKRECSVGLVREKRNATQKDLKYVVESRITFSKDTSKIDHDQDNPIIQEIYGLYQIHLDHATEDVRTMMTNFLKASGVAIRPSGGVYFVPSKFQAVLESLCNVVEKAGQNETFQLKVVESPEAKQTIAKVAKAGLEEELRQIQEQLEKFAFDKAREGTLEKKLEGFEELRAKAKMFADVLEFKVDEINNKIDRAKAIIHGHILPDEKPPVVEELHDALPVAATSDTGF